MSERGIWITVATEDQPSNRAPPEEHASNGGITITRNRVIRSVFTNKNVQHAVNLIAVALFFYAIYLSG